MATGEWNIKLLPPSLMAWEPQGERSRQIAVLMSGGIDSSVSAYLLKKQGWDVLGITMKIPTAGGENARGCCGVEAAFVCHELNIPHYFIDVTGAFQELIIEPFRESYAKGETPNPCVDCNALLKFSLVWDFLQEKFGILYLATGHYARIIVTDSGPRLARAADRTKDQSYFLYGIARERLERLVLPVGELTKQQVRSIAVQLNLSVADKPESMELCFVAGGDYRAMLATTTASQAGDITDMQGNKIGTHKGIVHYTVGQRRGVGFAGGKPLYVGRIDPKKNTIALGTREQVCSHTVKANQINVLVPEQFVKGGSLYGKIRSYGDPKPCKIVDISQTEVTVEFDEPQFAPCPGQKLVLYDDNDNVIVGGTIMPRQD